MIQESGSPSCFAGMLSVLSSGLGSRAYQQSRCHEGKSTPLGFAPPLQHRVLVICPPSLKCFAWFGAMFRNGQSGSSILSCRKPQKPLRERAGEEVCYRKL